MSKWYVFSGVRYLLYPSYRRHCTPWGCLRNSFKASRRLNPDGDGDSTDYWDSTDGETSDDAASVEELQARLRGSNSLDGKDDPLGKMLFFGHEPKLFFIKALWARI